MNSSEQSFAEPATDPREQPEWQDVHPHLQLDHLQPPRGRSRWFWLGVSLLVLIIIFGGLATASVLLTHQITTSRTVTVGSTPRLVLTSQAGSVHVVNGPAGQIRVVMRQRVFVGDNNPIPVPFALSQDGNTVTITSNQRPGIAIGLYDSEVDFNITAPSQTNLDIQTESGDITSQGINGQMTVTTSSGDITLTTASTNGDSTLQTSSGDITYNGTLVPSASSEFQTSSGTVDLTLASSAAFQVRASTGSGSIDSDFSGVNILRGNGSGAVADGMVGSPPYAQISIQVSSGDIHLRIE
ncbi:MAG: DUF4097 family beta strand repeat-containing protein [Ktedonobacterales bacterium]